MLESQYAVHHDEAQLIQTSKEAADTLRELFEADAITPVISHVRGAAD